MLSVIVVFSSDLLYEIALAAVGTTLAAFGAAIASFFSDETTAEGCETSFQASAVALLLHDDLLGWALLILHRRTLVVSTILLRRIALLGRVATAVALLRILRTLVVVTLACHLEVCTATGTKCEV